MTTEQLPTHYRSAPNKQGPQKVRVRWVPPSSIVFSLSLILLAVLALARTSNLTVRCERSGSGFICTALTQRPLFNSSVSTRVSMDKAQRMQFTSGETLTDGLEWVSAVDRGLVIVPRRSVLVFDGRSFRDNLLAPARVGMWRQDDALQAAQAVFTEQNSNQFAFVQNDRWSGDPRGRNVHVPSSLLFALSLVAVVYVVTRRSLFLTVVVDPEAQTVSSKRIGQPVVTGEFRDGKSTLAVTLIGGEPALVVSRAGTAPIVLAGPLPKGTEPLARLQGRIQSILNTTPLDTQTPLEASVLPIISLALALLVPMYALVAAGGFVHALPSHGAVELRSTSVQCGYLGMTLLPGGVTQWSEAVGAHVLTATRSNGSTLRVRYEVEPHRTTVLRCEDIDVALEPTNPDEYGLFVTPSTGAFIVAPPVTQTARTLPNEP